MDMRALLEPKKSSKSGAASKKAKPRASKCCAVFH